MPSPLRPATFQLDAPPLASLPTDPPAATRRPGPLFYAALGSIGVAGAALVGLVIGLLS